MTTATEVRVLRYPRAEVLPEDFELVEQVLEPLQPGQVVVRNTWTSADPNMRIRLRPQSPAGYFPSFGLGRPMDNIPTVGIVDESRHPDFPVGSTVWHAQGWRSHAVVDADADANATNGLAKLRVLDVSAVGERAYLGPLGGIGLSAYVGLKTIDALEANGTIWVSAAAGAVGSLVCQIAEASGLRVVASAGSDEKVEWLLDELGVDAAFNWRGGDLPAALERCAPEGLDFYFDSVGGSHLDAALDVMNVGGRICLCGAISEYGGAASGPTNLFLATSKSLTLRGFRASANGHLMPEMHQLLAPWIAGGRLRFQESVYEGLPNAPRALADLLAGRTLGKALVDLRPPWS